MNEANERPFCFFDPRRAGAGRILELLSAAPRLALDTESNPFHRYFDEVCLLQVSVSQEDVFIDPLEHGLPDPIRALLSDPARTWVVHGAMSDVLSLKKSFGVSLGRVFDTSVAAQLLGKPGIGLKALLETELGVFIDKSEQRSDWGRRPLSREQLEYARRDTMHLLALAGRLEAELSAVGRLGWHAEECDRIIRKEPVPRSFDPESWRSIKGAKELGPEGRKILSAFFLWREAEATREDRPPFRIVNNEAMLALARRVEKDGPGVLDRLRESKLLPPKLLPASTRAVLEAALAAGLSGPDPGRRSPNLSGVERAPRPSPEVQVRQDRLREARKIWSAALQLDPGFLLPNPVIARLAAEAPRTPEGLSLIDGLTGWRADVLAPEILKCLWL